MFVTASFPLQTDIAKLQPRLAMFGFRLSLSTNESIQKTIGKTLYGRITANDCDCSIVLGRKEYSNDLEQKRDTFLREAKALQKKGWSSAKIERWREQKQRTAKRNIETENDISSAALENWSTMISSILLSGLTEYIGLLVHFYNGTIESDKIEIKDQMHYLLDPRINSLLHEMELDKFYFWHRSL